MPDEENPPTSARHYNLTRRNKLIAKERRFKGLPVGADFYDTRPFALGLYYLVKDEASPLTIRDYRDKVSDLLLSLDQEQTKFFCKLVEREIDIEEEVSWLDSIEGATTEAN